MGMGIVRAYIRCSTNETKQDLQRQVRELEKQHQVDKFYKEYVSGSREDREQYNRLLEDLETGDTILATEVSRLSRSTKQFVELLELVKRKGLRLIVGTMVIDCRDNAKMDVMTEATLKIMSVFSELEKQMTSERVKSGMENAKAKGKVLGRPKATTEDVPAKFKDSYKLYLDKKINVTDLAKLNDLSRTTVYKYIRILEAEGEAESNA
jgi:DNA invertase Pin-like site-specific DNA recombinase